MEPLKPVETTAAPAAKPADSNGEPVKYIGPGSCAATSCHGSVKPVAGSRILQNEYSTWIVKDKHSHAYQALTGDIGERIARILKLNSKAEESPKCLACHALCTQRRSSAAAHSNYPMAFPAKIATAPPPHGWVLTLRATGRTKNPSR